MFKFTQEGFFSEEKSFFHVQRIMTKLLGFWPGSDNIQSWQIVFTIINAVEIWANGVFQAAFCFDAGNDLLLLLRCLTPLLKQTITPVIIFLFVWKRRDIKKILDVLYDSFVNGKLGRNFSLK